MNKHREIFSALNYAAIAVCLFFIFFLSFINKDAHIVYFVLALVLFLTNIWFIKKKRTEIASILFSVAANGLVLLFDAGYTYPTCSFVFYFPLLFSTYLLADKDQKKARIGLMALTLFSMFLTNFTDLTPKLAKRLYANDHVEVVALFNITVALASSMFVFRSYRKAYIKAEQKVIEEKDKLHDTTQMLNAINQNIDVSIYRISKTTGRLVYANVAYLELFGYKDLQEALKLYATDVYANPADNKKVIRILDNIGEIKNMQLKYKTKNGMEFWGLLSSVKGKDSHGNDVYDGAIKDITQLKQIEEELVSSRNSAQAQATEKSGFLHTMAHEIRTPLDSLIMLNDQLIKDSEGSPLSNLALLRTSAENLKLAFNNILDLSQFDAGVVELEWLPVNLNTLAGNVMKTYESQAIRKDIGLHVESNLHEEEVFITDAPKLVRILNNLVSNAVKYTKAGMIKLSIKAYPPENKVSRVLFVVSDTGVGIDQMYMDKIFDSFVYEGPVRKFQSGGRGLGLFTTQRLLDLMGSSLSVTSTKGKGSDFSFELWLNVSEEGALNRQEEVFTSNLGTKRE